MSGISALAGVYYVEEEKIMQFFKIGWECRVCVKGAKQDFEAENPSVRARSGPLGANLGHLSPKMGFWVQNPGIS